jgi:serine O-acetyltransferase
MLNFLINPGQNNITQLKADLQRRSIKFEKQDRFSIWRYYWSNKQYRTLLFYRLALSMRFNILKWFFWQLYLRLSLVSGLEVLTPMLGGGVILPHWGRIILNAEEIGANLYCFHNVTVGNDYRTGIPKIGNNVFIGTGSIILGKISIGDNVVIGAASFVNADIPSNSLVAGNPAKVLKSISNDYIKKMLGY